MPGEEFGPEEALEETPEEGGVPGEEFGPEEVLEETPEEEGVPGEEFALEEALEDAFLEEGMEEAPAEEAPAEEGFDLPEDFDIGSLDIKEGPPEELFKEEAAPEATEEEIKGPETGVGEEIQQEIEVEAGEPALEDFEMPELEEIESIEEAGEPAVLEGEEEFELPELGEGGLKEMVLPEEQVEPEEVPPEEEEIEEVPPEEEEIEEVPPGGEEFEEVPPGEEEFEEYAETPSEEREGVPVSAEEIEIELSDEDVVLITTKLKQLSPVVASRVKDLIVKVTLPLDSMKRLLELLILDVPEDEIVQYIEQATGKKITRRKIPEIIPAVRKPGRITAAMATVGPLVRVTGLSVLIIAVISIIFMLFLYKPLKANKYYKEGIEYIKQESYPQAEESFKKATSILKKAKEYDNFGWEYMLSGNYDAAIQKYTEGMAVDKNVKNIDIRIHLALLYNVLSKYDEAGKLYDEIIEKRPAKYEYKKLKGRNLIDWGVEENERLDQAYLIFKEEFSTDPKNSDALSQMLYVNILQKDTQNIDYLYNLLNEKYPQQVDKEVDTELAAYYISVERLEPVWDILAEVINRFPKFPMAYLTFSRYFKEIDNKDKEEYFLNRAIMFEKERELKFPWDKRDRTLLSNAYNNLGELYARMELPGKEAESINYFKQAIEENSDNEVAYFNLAQAYFYKEKNYDLARKYYKTAQKMGYENNDLNYNLGLLYFYDKSFNKALNQWAMLSEIMPSNPNIKFAMGSAFLHLEKYNPALGEFLMLSEIYDDLIKELGNIKPWRAYHKRILL
ncbi:MAG: tetratricopeptide repeat protein, partial [Spirochaetes bacterium]|nr:tetratricopeptide repeat protein [Spirochaetota bacterium]